MAGMADPSAFVLCRAAVLRGLKVPNRTVVDPTSMQPHVAVWNTCGMPKEKRFETFRDGVCSSFMRWTIDCPERVEFSAQIESLTTVSGSIAHCFASPLKSRRTVSDLSKSPWDCVYANYVLCGSYEVEQFGRTQIAEAGDLIVYDSSTQLNAELRGSARYSDVSFMVHKDVYGAHLADQLVENYVLKKSALMRPLDSALTFLSKNMQSLPPEELEAVFDAVIRMLPSAVQLAQGDQERLPNLRVGQEITRELMDYLNRELSNPELSPASAAAYLGISVRYVHKLLALSGTTFSTQVTNQRLDRVCSDLCALSDMPPSISKLAFRWGFNDLSTFNRLFKRKYGLTPKEYRGSGDADARRPAAGGASSIQHVLEDK